MVEGFLETKKDMFTVFRFGKFKLRATGDDFDPV
jgi:hypothetical protein